jgi:hypothetical protein
MHAITADFYDVAGERLGRITRHIEGEGGARLIAATSSTGEIARVVVYSDASLAIGEFRVTTSHPE